MSEQVVGEPRAISVGGVEVHDLVLRMQERARRARAASEDTGLELKQELRAQQLRTQQLRTQQLRTQQLRGKKLRTQEPRARRRHEPARAAEAPRAGRATAGDSRVPPAVVLTPRRSRPRLTGILLVAVVAAAAVAIVASRSSSPIAAPADPVAAVTTFASSVQNGDYTGACRLLTGAPSNCPSLMAATRRAAPALLARLGDAANLSSAVRADRATVQGGPQIPARVDMHLRLVSGRWLIVYTPGVDRVR
jgi:hypothetical protein